MPGETEGCDGYIIFEGLDSAELARAHGWIAEHSYWAAGIPIEVFLKAARHSLMFGVRHPAEGLVAVARVVSDRATFAWLCDVFVDPAHRGCGLAGRLVKAVQAHPDLTALRRMLLATKDAHTLYAQHGFQPLASPARWMEIHDPDVYRRSSFCFDAR